MKNLLGHIYNMDWAQIITSFVGVLAILFVPIGWVVTTMYKLDRRTTILETKNKIESRKLDSIDEKISDVVDSVQIIKVAIAKIETLLGSRADDSLHGR